MGKTVTDLGDKIETERGKWPAHTVQESWVSYSHVRLSPVSHPRLVNRSMVHPYFLTPNPLSPFHSS